jgi:hypothetical protein
MAASRLDLTESGRALIRYWLGEGLYRWAFSPHPWTTLRDILLGYMSKREADGLASTLFERHFGYTSGERKGDNPIGPG